MVRFVDISAFFSFLTGIIFGAGIAALIVVQFLSQKREVNEVIAEEANIEPEVPLGEDDVKRLNQIIDHLEDVNSPLKNVSADIQKIHSGKTTDANVLESKMRTIMEPAAIVKLEKECLDNL